MRKTDDDSDLRAALTALREADAAHAPSFAKSVRGRRRASRRALPAMVVAFAAVFAVLVSVWFVASVPGDDTSARAELRAIDAARLEPLAFLLDPPTLPVSGESR